jgi:hypothetical protein
MSASVPETGSIAIPLWHLSADSRRVSATTTNQRAVVPLGARRQSTPDAPAGRFPASRPPRWPRLGGRAASGGTIGAGGWAASARRGQSLPAGLRRPSTAAAVRRAPQTAAPTHHRRRQQVHPTQSGRHGGGHHCPTAALTPAIDQSERDGKPSRHRLRPETPPAEEPILCPLVPQIAPSWHASILAVRMANPQVKTPVAPE